MYTHTHLLLFSRCLVYSSICHSEQLQLLLAQISLIFFNYLYSLTSNLNFYRILCVLNYQSLKSNKKRTTRMVIFRGRHLSCKSRTLLFNWLASGLLLEFWVFEILPSIQFTAHKRVRVRERFMWVRTT